MELEEKKLFDPGKVIEGFKKTNKGLHERKSNSARERGRPESGRKSRKEEKRRKIVETVWHMLRA